MRGSAPPTSPTWCSATDLADLLFLLGLATHLEAAWDEPSLVRYLHRLGSFARVAMLDFRGSGLSDPLTDAVTLEALVDDLIAVVTAAGLRRPIVVTCNEASLVALPFAAAHPELIGGLVVVNGTARVVVGEDYPFGIDPADVERYRENIEHYADHPMPLAYSAPSRRRDPAFAEWATRYQRMAVSPGHVHHLTELAMATDVRDVLPILRGPALVLHTAGDRYLTVPHGRYLADGIAGARFVELAGADHLAWVGPGVDAQLDEIERFVTGGVGAPRTERQLATVLFTDIVRSTEQLAALGDRQWTELLRLHDDIARRAVLRQRGRVVKTTGDGILAVFDGPSRAVAAALQLQHDTARIGVEVRAGLHTGEVELEGDDVRGLAVHVAARVMGAAVGGQLLTSRTVRDLSAGSGHRFEAQGSFELKGLPDPLELFAVGA